MTLITFGFSKLFLLQLSGCCYLGAFSKKSVLSCPLQANLYNTIYTVGTPLFRGHLHSGVHKLWPWKNVDIIFVSVTSVEGIPLFRGKGHFLGPKEG